VDVASRPDYNGPIVPYPTLPGENTGRPNMRTSPVGPIVEPPLPGGDPLQGSGAPIPGLPGDPANPGGLPPLPGDTAKPAPGKTDAKPAPAPAPTDTTTAPATPTDTPATDKPGKTKKRK